MANLDRLLRVLVDHDMDALVLEPGKLPRLLQKDGNPCEVTKTRLDDGLIRLLAEELGADPAPEPGPAAEWRFDYRLDGTAFRFTGHPRPHGWLLEVRPAPSDAAADRSGRPTAPAAAEPTEPAGSTACAEPDTSPVPATSTVPAAPAGPAGTGGARLTIAPNDGGTTEPSRPGGGDGALLPALDEVLSRIVEMGASDLHLSAGQRPRARIDGDMTVLPWGPPSPERLRDLLRDLAPENRWRELEETNDVDFGHELPGLARFRVNLFRDRLGVGAVLRQIPETVPSADDLGLPAAVRELAMLPKGLVLVTGPTGSGKSTTLAAILDEVNRRRDDHVITIEDPIEFVHESKRCLVNQRQVGEHTDSFANALRAALREDPDVVLVGEMRDLETAAIAIETAETGHLVFGTLHTTSAISTIERLVNQFPAERQEQVRMMLSESLKAVISQNLLKRIGGGRVAAQEILLCNRAVSNLIRESKAYQITSIMQTSKKRGNVLLNEALLELVKSGTVEAREAYRKAVDKDDLLARYRTEGIDLDTETDPAEEEAA